LAIEQFVGSLGGVTLEKVRAWVASGRSMGNCATSRSRQRSAHLSQGHVGRCAAEFHGHGKL